MHDEAMDTSAAETAKLYQEWARVEAHGSSIIYERLALAVAEDPAILEFLSKVEPAKRQPNLLFGAMRWHNVTVDELLACPDGGTVTGYLHRALRLHSRAHIAALSRTARDPRDPSPSSARGLAEWGLGDVHDYRRSGWLQVGHLRTLERLVPWSTPNRQGALPPE